MKQPNTILLEALTSADVITVFHEWEKQRSKNAMFESMINDLHRVEAIRFIVAATRNTDLELHLQAREQLSKLFFAFDRIKYKRPWPRYISTTWHHYEPLPDLVEKAAQDGCLLRRSRQSASDEGSSASGKGRRKNGIDELTELSAGGLIS